MAAFNLSLILRRDACALNAAFLTILGNRLFGCSGEADMSLKYSLSGK